MQFLIRPVLMIVFLALAFIGRHIVARASASNPTRAMSSPLMLTLYILWAGSVAILLQIVFAGETILFPGHGLSETSLELRLFIVFLSALVAVFFGLGLLITGARFWFQKRRHPALIYFTPEMQGFCFAQVVVNILMTWFSIMTGIDEMARHAG